MNYMKRLMKLFSVKAMNFLQFLRPELGENLKFFTKRALLYADYCRLKGIVVGDNDKFLLGPDIKLWLGEGAKIVIKKSCLDAYPYPPNPLIPEAIGLGVEYESRFIPFPQVGRSTINLLKGARLELESGVYILPGLMLRARDGATIKIAAGTCFGHNVTINTKCGLSVGRYVRIALGALIMDYDGHPIWHAQDEKPDGYVGEGKPIVIEDNVWIGMKAIILKGVRVAQGSIVGAGAVVTKDVPPNSIVAGNPARVVKEGIKWTSFC